MPEAPLIHFKCETCVSIDPKGVAEYLFGENQHLVVLHKGKNENPHWHFQGYLQPSMKDYCALLSKLANGHSKKIAKPKSRPVKRKTEEATEMGFQYMLKEDPPIIVCFKGFTQEQLDALHEASNAHVASLKSEVLKVCEDIKFEDFADRKMVDLHNYARNRAFMHYVKVGKMPPPNFQTLVKWHLVNAAIRANFSQVTKLQIYVAQTI